MLFNLSKRRDAGPADLVALLAACHERIRRFVALAHRVATHEDAPGDEITAACEQVDRYFTLALPLHVADEEESIAPRLRGRSSAVDGALDTMKRQHRAHEPELVAFLRAVGAVGRDPGDEAAKAALLERARDLDAELTEHLEMEETVLFPAIREHLSPDVQAEIVAELRKRRGDPDPAGPPRRAP